MNYFIAYTPLHILIIQEIIKKEKITNYILFYFFDVDSEKNKYYFNKLAQNAIVAHYLKKKISLKLILILIKLKFQNISKGKSNIYCGNLKTFYSRIIIYFLNPRIFSFDDGLGNLVKDGYLYDKSEKKFSALFFGLFKNKLLYKNITKHIVKHYSIYSQENIYKNKQVLNFSFINEFNNVEKLNFKNTNILIGTIYSESGLISLENEIKYIRKIIEKYNIEFYIPHPRCKKENIENVEKIISEKIAEEIILDLLLTYSEINVFGAYSTALLNLSNVKGLNIFNIEHPYFDNMNGIKVLFEDFNIKTIKL